MEQTEQFQLSQWAAEDRILREDFNSDHAKVEAAILGRLGAVEEIQSAAPEAGSARQFSLDLTGFDWSAWSIVAFVVHCPVTSYNLGFRLTIGGVSNAGLCADEESQTPLMGVLFPGRDGASRVCCVGFPGGRFGASPDPYTDLTAATVSLSEGHFQAGTELVMYGIR